MNLSSFCLRHYNCVIYRRLLIDVPLTGPFSLRCHTFVWSYGFSSYKCPALPLQSPLQCLPTSRSGSKRKAEIHQHVDQQVRCRLIDLLPIFLHQSQKCRCSSSTRQGYVYKVVERVRPPCVCRSTRWLNWVRLEIFSVVAPIYTSFPVSMTSCSVFGYSKAIATRYRMSKESSALRRA